MKTKIPSLSYNAMFKAIISNNKYLLSKFIEAILDYYKLDIDIKDKELIIKNNELPIDNYQDRQLICDYIIKLDDNTEINIEVNRSKYIGVTERNLTYSFKIYYEHFKAGDNYDKFSKYTLLQINFNNYPNSNGKSINRFYMIDIDDIENRLSNSYSIMNIDIDKCYKLVYNKNNLEGISDLEKLSAIIGCEYLEDIASILERGKISMDKKEKEKLLKEIKAKIKDKDILEAIKLENSIDDRFKMIEAMSLEKGREENTVEIIKAMLDNNSSYEYISKITGKSKEEIDSIAKNM